jgi:hypothetical protein
LSVAAAGKGGGNSPGMREGSPAGQKRWARSRISFAASGRKLPDVNAGSEVILRSGHHARAAGRCCVGGPAMTQAKRSTRQRRREPVRRQLPVRRPTPATGNGRTPSRAEARFLVRGVEMLAIGALRTIDAELTPLYAMLAALHQVLDGREQHSALIASAQMARALELLGCDAELIVACTSVFRSAAAPELAEQIGEWSHPPLIRADATTDAHAVVWTDSFDRCVDLGVSCSLAVRRAVERGEASSGPAVLPAASRDALIRSAVSVAAFRGRLLLNWMFFPQWTPCLDLVLERHADAIDYGGRALAQVVVDQLAAVAVTRDLGPVATRFPVIGKLIADEFRLPDPGATSPGPQADCRPPSGSAGWRPFAPPGAIAGDRGSADDH